MSRNLDRLLAIMARLRDPVGGCPWDQVQTFRSIAPHTIEEAYEVADAIEQEDLAALKDELGDLLFQVVYQARIAEEQGAFAFNEVAGAIADKLIRRHPHVFGTEAVTDIETQTARWEDHKAAERDRQAAAEGRRASALDGVIRGLPALTRALKLQKRAARTGFEWTNTADILAKLSEELEELHAALAERPQRQDAISEEIGDLLFVLVNLARNHEIDAETALRHANAKFERRFRRVETLMIEQAIPAGPAALPALLHLWQQVKQEERG